MLEPLITGLQLMALYRLKHRLRRLKRRLHRLKHRL
jgi:hypothetical protein|tara:strand:+ start:134 stop:241 length:108 start_codon:yes stop_codon:yes gene_type:complete